MNGQVITMVEGIVPEEKWQELQDGYNQITKFIPEGILDSFIVQERNDPTLWRLVTLWKSFDHLKAMQQTHSVPPGIKIFRDINIEPKVKIFDVKTSLNIQH